MARPRLSYLTDADKEFVHEQILRVLAEVGVCYGTPTLTDLLVEAGATVDAEALTAKLPWELIERCLKTVPQEIHLAGRDPPTTAGSTARGCSTRVTAPPRTCSTT